MTRTEASERLGVISEDCLEKIENERIAPQSYDVLAMAKAYNKPSLCNYYCSHECPMARLDNPEENWAVFKNVHEPIIERSAFEQVQKRIGKTKRRAPKEENGEKRMFADLLYCADCGRKLWFHVNSINKIRFFSCSNYAKDYRGTCPTASKLSVIIFPLFPCLCRSDKSNIAFSFVVSVIFFLELHSELVDASFKFIFFTSSY